MTNKKRLIDAKPLMQNGWHLVRTGERNSFLGSMSLADVPTVDAVEVVRCKDCDSYCPETNDRPICLSWGSWCDPDGWCYRGERREGK